MKFILFHGSFGSPQSNWLPSLKEKLSGLHQDVIVPRFPVDNWESLTRRGEKVPPEKQSLESWMTTFEPIAAKLLDTPEPLCFVGHSIGCVFILHLVEKYNFKLDSAIFVAPFLSKLNKTWQIDAVNATFYKKDFDFKKLLNRIPTSYALYSENDPYVDQPIPLAFATKMKSAPILVKGAGHMNQDAHFIDFPLVFELCKTRL